MVLFDYVVIRTMHFFYGNGWVPDILLQLGGFSDTPEQTDGICATHMQISSVSTTLVKLGRVCALTHTIGGIGLSLRQSTFSSSVLQKNSNLPALRPNNFMPKSNNSMPNSKNRFCHPCLVLINLSSCRTIKPGLHLPWKGKSKRVINHVKGWRSL